MINVSYLQLSELLFKLIFSRITIFKLSDKKSDVLEPQLWALRPSHVTGELTMTNPCKSLSSCQLGEAATSYYGIISTEVKTTSSRSYDHLLGSLPSRSGSGGAQHSEMEEMSDTDNPGLVL